MQRKLNVGCGPDIRPASEGWVNMDIAPLKGVDVVHDLLSFPWPFEANSFDHVFMSHVMEHVPHYVGHKDSKDGFILTIEEIHRILKPGGTLEILSPHPDSPDVWADPTHTRVIHPKNFQYFDPDSRYNFYSPVRFRVRVAETSKFLPVLPNFLRMGKSRLPITEHVALRLPFLKRLLMRRGSEIRIVVEKVA